MACSSLDLDSIDLDLASRNLDLDLMTILHIIDLGGLQISRLELDQTFGAFSFVPLSEFVGRPSWTKSGP